MYQQSPPFKQILVPLIILFSCLNVVVRATDYIFDEDMIIEKMIEFNTSITKFGAFIYRKFQVLYPRITTCGLNIYEKAYACASVLNGPRYNYVLAVVGHYFHSPCQPYTMIISPRSKYFYMTHVQMRAFKCPAALRIEVNAPKNPIGFENHRGISYYVSGLIQPAAFVMFSEHAGYIFGKRIKTEMLVQNIPQNHFKLVKLREKMKPMQSFENPPEYSPHIPAVSKRITRQSTLILRRPISTEKMVTDLVRRIQQNRLTYSKFMNSYGRVNVCSLSSEQILYVCRLCYQNHLFNLLIGYSLLKKPKCQRKKIHYSYYPPTALTPIYINLIQCYIRGPKSDNLYYISTSTRLNTAIMYIQFKPYEEVFPEGKASTIDANVLKEINEEN